MYECTCETEVIEPHICPYKNDIHDDDTTLCTCCENCRDECAGDI